MPLRFPRPAIIGVAIGLASASIALGSMPALADSVRHHEWWLSKLGVTSAWQTSRGSGVTVAVLSDGVEPANPDLAGSVITGPDYTRSGRAASRPYFGLQGTAIASLIAGHGHGTGASQGIIGVAPAAKILSVRVTLSPGDPLLTSTAVTARLPGAIAAGIRYAVRNGAGVIDLPIDPGQPGASGTGGAAAAAGGSAAEQSAVAYALRKGVVLVAPAGDNGAGTDAANYPAAYPGVISAGAFDHDLMKAAYTSHQPYVTLTAPGEEIIAATAPGSYATMSSTSAASAIVAGITALIRSRFAVLSPAQVTQVLIHSTLFRRPGGTANGSGYGTANAARALSRAAVIAKPLTRRAEGRAPAPTPPAVASAASSFVSKVLKAVVISAGVLILLLLPITAYAAVGRRRARRAAQGRWQRNQPAEPGFAYAEAAAAPEHPDPMLEFFSPPSRPPASMSAAEPGRRAEFDSPSDVPFLAAGHGRNAGPRPSAADQARLDQASGDPGRFDRARFDPSGDPGRIDPGRIDPGRIDPGGFDPGGFDPGGFAGADSPSSAWPGPASGPASSPRPASPSPASPSPASPSPAGPSPAGSFEDFSTASGFSATGDPFGPATDPSRPVRDPSRPARDPFGPAEEPSRSARDQFGQARDPFSAASDPAAGAEGDRPRAAGRTRAGSHSRTGSPAPSPPMGPVSRPPLGPVSRPARGQPRISGTPPWEPAAKPDSELPWVTGPAPQRAHPAHVQPTHPARAAHRRMQRSTPPPTTAGSSWPDLQAPAPAAPPDAPAGSIWDAAARTSRRPDAHDGHGHDAGGHGAGGHDLGGHDPGGHDPGSHGADPGSGDVSSPEPGSGEDPGTGPIYVWNPGASTESFPSVPVNRDPSAPVDRD